MAGRFISGPPRLDLSLADITGQGKKQQRAAITLDTTKSIEIWIYIYK
jgi:hypothetical protein